ncbi:ABC transporter permease [Cytophagaceae bacterium DM2B3-1]|uniref:ABC transporter permease n=1 Tax=Xanthocytophaga flava TaxID=3048013 RepID=A0ABT7CDP6_9BACT|nr:ABC transporter permease [Xanthocytophaga flavus]MDJ1491793.1 ABC transporter permease [Xanthocytophaga flavus]
MLKNYLKIAIRNFWKHKVISAVNLLGLTLGLTACLLITTYILDEVSADKHWSKKNQLFRLVEVKQNGTAEEKSAFLISHVANTLHTKFPEVEAYTRGNHLEWQFKYGNKTIPAKTWAVESGAFSMFDFHFLEGGISSVDFNNNTLVISQKYAQQLFGKEDPVGKIIPRVSNSDSPESFKIAGVIENIPTNSHLYADVLFLKKYAASYDELSLFGNVYPQYVLLNENATPEKLAVKASAYLTTLLKSETKIRLAFQPLQEVHLKSHAIDNDGSDSLGDMQYIYLFSVIAVFLLLLACINYVNLTTAQSLQRGRETGLRKVLGANRREVIWQFLIESVGFFAWCWLLSLWMYKLTLPVLYTFIGKPLTINFTQSIPLFLCLALVTFLVSILTGIYPALLLSSYKPANVLKGFFGKANDRGNLRRVLVVTQFFVSTLLIVATIVVYKQLYFINHKNLGFYKDNLLHIEGWVDKDVTAIKHEILQNPNVVSMTISQWGPGDMTSGGMSMKVPDPLNPGQAATVYGLGADFDFLKTMQIPLREGRDFDMSYAADRINIDSLMQLDWTKYETTDLGKSLIINETGVRKLGLKNPIGASVQFNGMKGRIIGVMADYHSTSFHNEVPIILLRANAHYSYGYPLIRIRPGKLAETTAQIESIWKKHFPDRQFDYTYVDDRLEKLYMNEQQLGKLFGYFSALAIFISCLGLIGLAAFATERRTKEIGIRKVLGATVANIFTLLSKDFLKLILIAFVVAIPLSVYLMNQWLQKFAYRIEISWWIFALAGVCIMGVAILAVSFQTIKAALSNPVNSLRNE